jgi:uncharacterized protein (TIGR02217 family)
MSQLVYPTLAGLTFPVVRAPQWKTLVSETASGREFRSRLLTYPRYLYRLKYEVLRDVSGQQDLQTLLGFFNQVGGDYDTFLFSDPNDNAVTAQQFAAGDGVTKNFQLVRGFGGFVEPIFDPQTIASLTVAGVTKTLGVDCTTDGHGVIQFSVAPANGAAIVWSGTYYWRCRFTTPAIEFEKFLNTFWQVGRVEFRTVKP